MSIIDDCETSNGSLYSLGRYLDWRRGAVEATLDGDFTAEELRAIADHMDAKTAIDSAVAPAVPK